ncbi:MAG TPA: hypothetical protein VL485_17930 [Ktedonobacteraceae bacterium]|jgi:hypothetical protein|nr:hypothetical protein [Ktedonobacteraceae bacterium]
MQQETIYLVAEAENQKLQEHLNQQSEVELSDSELTQIRGAQGIPYNRTYERYDVGAHRNRRHGRIHWKR